MAGDTVSVAAKGAYTAGDQVFLLVKYIWFIGQIFLAVGELARYGGRDHLGARRGLVKYYLLVTYCCLLVKYCCFAQFCSVGGGGRDLYGRQYRGGNG